MWRNRLVLFAILFLIISLITVPFSASPIFATHAYDDDYSNDSDYYGKTKLRFYQIFASKDIWYEGACDDEKNSFLRSNTIEVLRMYYYLPIMSKMECVKVTGQVEIDEDKWFEESNYGLTLEQVNDRVDTWHLDGGLLIIILDTTFSIQYVVDSFNVFPHGAGGHIVYQVIKQDAKSTDKPTTTIISTTNLFDFTKEQPTATRTMAHEIAHFAVYKKYGSQLASGTIKNNVCYYEGQPQKDYGECFIATRAVHDIHYDLVDCMNSNSLDTCTNLWTTVKAHDESLIPVMSPDYVMQYAESLKPKQVTPKQVAPKQTTPDYSSIIEKINDTVSRVVKLKNELSAIPLISIDAVQFENPQLQSELQRLKYDKNFLDVRLSTVYVNQGSASLFLQQGKHDTVYWMFTEIENELISIISDTKSYDRELRNAISKDLQFKREQSVQQEQSLPETS